MGIALVSILSFVISFFSFLKLREYELPYWICLLVCLSFGANIGFLYALLS